MKRLAALLTLLCAPAFARDIDVDKLYIKPESKYYTRIVENKIDAYRLTGARFVDKNVIFADWITGHDIVYIRELDKINVIYIYNRLRDTSSEIARLEGSITSFKSSPAGRYIFLKRIRMDEKHNARGESVAIKLPTGEITPFHGNSLFLDFSLSPGGISLFYDTPAGIAEYYPDSGIEKKLIPKSQYSDISSPGSVTLAYISPNMQKKFLISGSGGSYSSKLISKGFERSVPGVTSSSEFYWIDNNLCVCRGGGPGAYTVNLFDTNSSKVKVLAAPSLNTNLNYSSQSKIISYLKDQIIHFYMFENGDTINTGLEGEDVSYSPDSSRFVSLYLSNLFISSTGILEKRRIQIQKNAEEILALYESLLKTRSDWENEYTQIYISRKISAYKKIIGKK